MKKKNVSLLQQHLNSTSTLKQLNICSCVYHAVKYFYHVQPILGTLAKLVMKLFKLEYKTEM